MGLINLPIIQLKGMIVIVQLIDPSTDVDSERIDLGNDTAWYNLSQDCGYFFHLDGKNNFAEG